MELLAYIKIIYRYLWLIIPLVGMGMSGAWYISRQQPAAYQAETALFINPIADNPMWPYQRIDGVTLASLYSDIIGSNAFASQVAQQVAADVSAEAVNAALSTEYDDDHQFLIISATHTDPYTALQIAQAAGDVFIIENASRIQAQQQNSGDAVVGVDRQQFAQLQFVLQEELFYINEQITEVQNEIASLQGQTRSAQLNARVQGLMSELFSLRSLRADVLSNMPTSIVEPASLPTSPLPTPTLMYLIQGFSISLILALGLIFLFEYMDQSFRTAEQLTSFYGLSTMSTIPTARIKKKQATLPPSLVVLSDTVPIYRESFRTLRLAINIAAMQTPIHSILVTSAKASEGTTFVAANLASSFAQNGQRTVLVDANLRIPALHSIFDVPQAPGFTEMVAQAPHIDDTFAFLHGTGVENLWVLTSGAVTPQSPDVHGSPGARHIMKHLRTFADVMIYDSPPLEAGIDAVVLATQTSAVLQVVRSGHTNAHVVLNGKRLLENADAHLLGPVLNRSKKRFPFRYRGSMTSNHTTYNVPDTDNGNGHESIDQNMQVETRTVTPQDEPVSGNTDNGAIPVVSTGTSSNKHH
jgi:non-specific protein-tyrosine kinase